MDKAVSLKSLNTPKSPSVKKHEICSDPISADPISPFPSTPLPPAAEDAGILLKKACFRQVALGKWFPLSTPLPPAAEDAGVADDAARRDKARLDAALGQPKRGGGSEPTCFCLSFSSIPLI